MGVHSDNVWKLTIDDQNWQRKFTPVDGVPESDVVEFGVEYTEQGPSLVVGRWLGGERGAGYEYREALPFARGTIRGMYRTEGLRSPAVRIEVAFYCSEKRIGMKSMWMGVASDWTAFEFTVRVPAPGSDRMVPRLMMSQKAKGRVWFARLEATPEVVTFPAQPDVGQLLRAAPPADLGKGEFYRLAERDGTYWFVTPAGKGLYSSGTDGPWFRKDEDHLASGPEYAEFLYGCGFNTLAGWTDTVRWGELNDLLVARGRPPFATFSAMETWTHTDSFDVLVGAQGKDTAWAHDFPDPFDPRFEQWYREQAKRRAEAVKGKSWFAGWFADNEAGHEELYRRVYSPNCAAALKEHLRNQYGEIGTLNAAWSTGFSSFDDLIEKKPDPVLRRGPMYDDFRRFEREIVRRYVSITIRALRAADPDHLVISNRFMLNDVGSWIDLLDLYQPYDAIAVNLYPANQRLGLSRDEKEIYRMAHEKTGLPVIVGEWSVPAADSGLYTNPDKLDWSFNELLPTQKERAAQAERVTLDFFNMPFVIGSHWFIWKDVVNQQREANRGLFTHDDKPWRELTEALARAHRKMGVSLAV